MFHNEALALVDLLLAGLVEGTPIAVPPSSPSLGTLYRVAAGATGAFVGQDGYLAGWSAGGWRFVSPVEGMRLTERTSGVELAFRNGVWASGSMRASEVVIGDQQVVGARLPPIADATGGTTIDSAVRLTVAQILSGLRAHGLIAS